MSKVFCLGELLWDMIPSGKLVGGAPFNVAYHLKKFGTESIICTRVGNDDDGKELVAFVQEQGIETSFIQVDEIYPTSRVDVIYDDKEGIRYDIVKPVAWDFIDKISYELNLDDYLLYGSLVFRNDISRNSVLNFLKETSATKVFDVNLRAPHYDKETLFEVLALTDILKINEEELHILVSWIDKPNNLYVDTQLLLDQFGLKEIICTLGSKGAYYCNSLNDDRFFINALKINVVDTIGSGDSFLAGFLNAKTTNTPIKQGLQFAVSLAGFISSQKGGCPAYTVDEFNRFKTSNPII